MLRFANLNAAAPTPRRPAGVDVRNLEAMAPPPLSGPMTDPQPLARVEHMDTNRSSEMSQTAAVRAGGLAPAIAANEVQQGYDRTRVGVTASSQAPDMTGAVADAQEQQRQVAEWSARYRLNLNPAAAGVIGPQMDRLDAVMPRLLRS